MNTNEEVIFEEAADKYLENGINYGANTIKNADEGDLRQLAYDSFHYGYLFCKKFQSSELEELWKEIERVRQSPLMILKEISDKHPANNAVLMASEYYQRLESELATAKENVSIKNELLSEYVTELASVKSELEEYKLLCGQMAIGKLVHDDTVADNKRLRDVVEVSVAQLKLAISQQWETAMWKEAIEFVADELIASLERGQG